MQAVERLTCSGGTDIHAGLRHAIEVCLPPPPSEHRVSLLPRVRTARLTEVGCQGRHEEDTVGKIRIRLDRVQNALENNRIDVADNLGPIGVKYKFESDLFVIFLIAGRFFTSSICVSRPSGIVWRMSTGARR